MLSLFLSVVVCYAADSAPAPELFRAASADRPQTPQDEDTAFEASQTQKLLGVPVKEFPPPQGLSGLDELPASAPTFKFTVTERPLSGAPPRAWYELRRKVEARAPDGTLYEAYSGYDDPKEIVPGDRPASTPSNTRQRYGTHHGYAFNPQDDFIGRRESGRLKPTLFFRDVGSHTTAPHYLAIDGKGQAHLAVADVNIFQDNRLDLYWMVGDLASGKWAEAWLIDRRGFTSWSHPWVGAWGDKVHLLWMWSDVSVHKDAPGMGIFHVERSPGGFSRKVRVVPGVVKDFDAAIDPQSGRLLIVFSKEVDGKDDGVYVVSGSEGGSWTRPARLHYQIGKGDDASIEATGGGAFIIRTGAQDTREWVLTPR
jgi:hypothetical protein